MCTVTSRAYNKRGTGVDFYGVEVLCLPRSSYPPVLLSSDSMAKSFSADTFLFLLHDMERSIHRVALRPHSAGLFSGDCRGSRFVGSGKKNCGYVRGCSSCRNPDGIQASSALAEFVSGVPEQPGSSSRYFLLHV